MHELSRLAYLDSLGIVPYLSRIQLRGAAPSRRLAVVRGSIDCNEDSAPAVEPAAPSRPRLPALDSVTTARSSSARAAENPADRHNGAQSKDRVSFSLSAIVAGRILWLENLGDMPLASEQVALVQAMAVALDRCAAAPQEPARSAPEISRFDWPMHQNQQLDNSRDAATAGLTAFMQRRIEQFGCRAVVMLGDESARWAKHAALDVPVVQSLSTLQMLDDASCKAQVWRDLSSLRLSD